MQADVVVESVGAATWDKSVRVAEGRAAGSSCAAARRAPTSTVNLPRLFFKQYEIIGSSMGSYQEFAELTALVDKGLDVHVDQVLPLAEYRAALARLEAGEQLGKIVLDAPLTPSEIRRRAPPRQHRCTRGRGAIPGRGRRLLESPAVTAYVPEEFTSDEADVLRRYFTNLDGPVFALVNLPEVVKGALFARYSRSPKSLRRLFLDEFVGDLDISGDHTIDATVGAAAAPRTLYEKVFVEYGDDSVAQLGGVHLACEQASNILTKVLEWGRLMSYLEQSTRYIAYDARLGGRYRFYRDPAVLASRLGTRYVGDMDRLFDAYSHVAGGGHRPRPGDGRAAPRRQRLRVPPGDAGQGARRRPRHAAGGVAVQRRHLRQRAGVRGAAAADARPPAARGPRLRRADAARAAQGDPELPAPRRRRRARRALEHVPRHDPRAHRRARRLAVRRRAADAGRRR